MRIITPLGRYRGVAAYKSAKLVAPSADRGAPRAGFDDARRTRVHHGLLTFAALERSKSDHATFHDWVGIPGRLRYLESGD